MRTRSAAADFGSHVCAEPLRWQMSLAAQARNASEVCAVLSSLEAAAADGLDADAPGDDQEAWEVAGSFPPPAIFDAMPPPLPPPPESGALA